MPEGGYERRSSGKEESRLKEEEKSMKVKGRSLVCEGS